MQFCQQATAHKAEFYIAHISSFHGAKDKDTVHKDKEEDIKNFAEKVDDHFLVISRPA